MSASMWAFNEVQKNHSGAGGAPTGGGRQNESSFMPPDEWGRQLGLLIDDIQSPSAPLRQARLARSLSIQKAKGFSFRPWENQKTQSTLQRALATVCWKK